MAHQLVQAPGDTDSEYTGSASIPGHNRHWRSTGGIWSLLWQLLILKLWHELCLKEEFWTFFFIYKNVSCCYSWDDFERHNSLVWPINKLLFCDLCEECTLKNNPFKVEMSSRNQQLPKALEWKNPFCTLFLILRTFLKLVNTSVY